MTRAVMKEHTFSNGVTVPAGTTMGISGAVHQDNDVYPNPDEFLPFRHIEGANEDVDVSRRLFVSPSSEYRASTYLPNKFDLLKLTLAFSM